MTGLPFARHMQIGVMVLTTAITMVTVALDAPNWLGSWGETGAALESSTRLSYPAVGALAAWVSSAPKRERFEPWVRTTSRSRIQILLRLTCRFGLLTCTGFLLASATALIATGRQADFGSVPFLSLLTVCCGYIASVGVGVAAGQWLPGYLAPGVAIVVIFGWGFLASGLNPTLASLEALAVASDHQRTLFEIAPWVFLVKAIFLVGLAVALVSLAARDSSAWLLALSVVCLSATPLILSGTSTMRFVAASAEERCLADGKLQVCLTAARFHEAEDVMNAAKPLLTRLSGMNPGRITLREESLPGSQETIVGENEVVVPIGVTNGFNGNAHQVNSTDLLILISNRIFRERCVPQDVPNGNRGPVATATDVVESWALKSVGVPVDGSGAFNAPILTDEALDWRAVASFRSEWAKASSETKTRWLGEHGRDLFNCSTPKSDLRL